MKAKPRPDMRTGGDRPWSDYALSLFLPLAIIALGATLAFNAGPAAAFLDLCIASLR